MWINTNKLLEYGYNGIKTGNTPSAGNWMCSSYQLNGKLIIIVILKWKS